MTCFNLISLDVETGGLEDTYSLLTASFRLATYHTELQAIEYGDTLDLKLKPNDGVYVLSAGGMAVNKIDIVEHDRHALTYKEAKPLLYEFLKDNLSDGNKAIPVGQHVAFDVARVQQSLISIGSWENFVSYRCLDIASLSLFSMLLGNIDKEQKIGLQHIARLLGCGSDDDAWHTSEYDSITNLEVLRAYLTDVGGSNKYFSHRKDFFQ